MRFRFCRFKRMDVRPAASALLLLSAFLGGAMTAYADSSARASIQVECANNVRSGQVAMRWAHPKYNDTGYIPLFTVPCNVGVRTMQLTILDQLSEFEVQTEGGIETSYMIKAVINGPNPGETSFVQLEHAGSPNVATSGSGFTLTRSSGPNRYGEQNFRVQLPEGATAMAKIVAQSSGDRSDAQMALRWGHPDFNDHAYFPLWTIKAGNPQEKDNVPIKDSKSEFEIQTEGGTGTKYRLSIWLDFGNGIGMLPSIEIDHDIEPAEFASGSSGGVVFSPTKGNVYGEINVGVLVPWLPANRMPASDGTGGVNLAYNYGDVPITTTPASPITIEYSGQFLPGSSAATTGKTTFKTDHPNQALNPGPTNRFSDAEAELQPGTWKIVVGQLVDGVLVDTTTCPAVQITSGSAPVVQVDRPSRSCH